MPMQFVALDSDDFLAATNALLPPGRCFARDPDSWQTKFFSAIALFFWQLHADIVRLFLTESDPSQADGMLADWQQTYAIAPRGTLDQQRAQLAAVIADPGGFTSPHYMALAAGIGISISTEVTGAFTWTVHAAAALSPDDRAALEALIARYNRASCVVTFAYDL